MSNKKLLQAAAGTAAAGGGSLYAEDVFATHLYDGNGSNRSITNGIDLAGEGGLVWAKMRSGTPSGGNNVLYDTERGAGKYLISDLTSAQSATDSVALTSFNSNGFSLGVDNASGLINYATRVYASWTFRKAEKFFDVVTYTGDGVAGRAISHSLGSTPGMLIVKCTNASSTYWIVWHSSLTGNNYLVLNETWGQSSNGEQNLGNNVSLIPPTSTVFTVGDTTNTNANGSTYVAYLFASDAGGFGDDGSENIIKCGSFTVDGSGYSPNVELGFEPQWVLMRPATTTGAWVIVDTMRGWVNNGTAADDANLRPNAGDAEAVNDIGWPYSTGFYAGYRGSPGAEWIYVAIRRPMKTPEAGTEVFSPVARTGTGTTAAVTGVGFSPDLFIGNIRDTAGYWNGVVDRLRGVPKRLISSQTEAENTQTVITSFDMDGLSLTSDGNGFANENGKAYIQWLFKRAPGFMDVVAYTGTGSTHTEAHNLGVAPELIIIKKRDTTRSWIIYSKSIPINQFLTMPSPTAAATFSMWNDTAPTSSVFSIGTDGSVNASAGTYISYLFATVAGVSKVGSYTGTGADLNVDCGFTAGARFVLIKRTDSTGDWYTYDSERGIVAGNDPYQLLNSTAAEVTNTDYIDPLASGFTVTSSAPAALNASSGTYIFLAIS